MKKLIVMLVVISLMTSVSCNTVEAEPDTGSGEVSPYQDEEDAICRDAEMYAEYE